MDRLWLTKKQKQKKSEACLKTFCHDFIYVHDLTHCEEVQERQLVNRPVAAVASETKEVKKMEKVCRNIKREGLTSI